MTKDGIILLPFSILILKAQKAFEVFALKVSRLPEE